MESFRRTISIRNTFAELDLATSEVADSLRSHGASADAIRLVHLGLEEVVSNILKYGYDDREQHLIQIALSLRADELQIEITDDGREFNPLDQPEPRTNQPLEQREPGGLGIQFLRKLFDGVSYRRENSRNTLMLRKQLGPKYS